MVKEAAKDNLSSNKIKDKAKDVLKDKATIFFEDYEELSYNYAISFVDNAGLFENQSKLDRHKRIANEILSIKEEKSDAEKAKDLNFTGEIFYYSGKYKTAEEAFKKSRKIYARIGDTLEQEYFIVLNNLGLVYHTSGQLQESEKWTEKALQKRGVYTPQTEFHAYSLNNKAVLLKDKLFINDVIPPFLQYSIKIRR
jgi:tetratricopeptide (TPR) repeat protein